MKEHIEPDTHGEARTETFGDESRRDSEPDLIRTGFLEPGATLPLVVRPSGVEVDAAAWAAGHRQFIEAQLLRSGGLLFRGFRVGTPVEFEQFSSAVAPGLLEYGERSSPRTQVSPNVYTSTDYPADQSIFLHNENSYQRVFPQKIFFCCFTPAAKGGETPIADCRKIFARLSPKIRERFIEKKWMYVRNFGDGFGLPWQTVFQTEDREVVERECRRKGIRVEWKDGNRLRVSTVLPAVVRHPRSGDLCWFNHATFFHVTTLDAVLREVLLEEFAEADLPTNTYYGDGSAIEPAVLDELREAYRQETVSFPWQSGDVLLLDNMLTAHGRAPYSGPRKVLVAMSEPTSRDDLGTVGESEGA
jgi:alpha-ketoglutarate-dependent taurine dioxygenase